jgi:hypothetical protein
MLSLDDETIVVAAATAVATTTTIPPPKATTGQRIDIEDFEIGSKVQRLFDDGNWYIARVMTEPKYAYDVDKKKGVLSRMIKYFADDQEEWADENQLNDWAYNFHKRTRSSSNDTTDGNNKKDQDQDNSDDTNCRGDEYDGKKADQQNVDWLHNGYDEEEGDDDDSLLPGIDNEEDIILLSGNKGKYTIPEQHARKSKANATITPPPSEIAPRSLFQNTKRRLPEYHNSVVAEDNLSEMTGSSVAGSCINSIENKNDNDGRRRSKRARKQTNSFLASAASNPKKPPPPQPDASDATLKKNPRKNSKKNNNLGIVTKTIEEIRKVLKFKMGITEEEVDFALKKMSPPYSQNEAINIIHEHRKENRNMLEDDEVDESSSPSDGKTKFNPEIGLRVRVREGGSNYYGTVTDGPNNMIPEGADKPVKMWTVTFDDDSTKEDYDWSQLLRYRASRPIINFESCLGRPLNALELFCGEGIVTQELCELKFNVKSIDNNPDSYATNVLDIRTAKYKDIGDVPDFIWASPPCTTFSNLAGGSHRNIPAGEFEKSQEAHDHNDLFAQMVYIMRWAKSKNPHLIVVIENPQAQMQKSPDMIEFMKTFGLHKATVHYCAFGRLDKKPTNLWTNVSYIYSFLLFFRSLLTRIKLVPLNFLTSHSNRFHSNPFQFKLYCGLLDFDFRTSVCTHGSPNFIVPREDVPITTEYIPLVSAPTDKTSMRRPYLKSLPN